MLGSHALHAVREQHHQSALPHPLGLAGADELQQNDIISVQNNEKYLLVTKFSAIFTSIYIYYSLLLVRNSYKQGWTDLC